MTASQPSDIFQAGDLLNNTYRIETILGRGGTSEVYKARSEISGRVMAIKALRAEFASNEDFLVLMTREEDIRDVRHDAIVRYFDTQRMADGVVDLVMDYVDGPGLDRKLAEGGMRASDLMIVGERVCEGLIAAHGRNIVHRDLSPDNIILRNDNPSEAVIIDFGIAKDTNPGAETIVGNEFAGKYAYAAPEQLSGRTDPRSDIYSLGALLLSTFRGEKPDIGRNPMEVVEKKAQPLDLEGVPEPLRSLIARMSHPDPDKRFPSAEALLEAFRNPDKARAPVGDADETEAELDDATVIAAPIPARASERPASEKSGTSPEPIGIPKSGPASADEPKKGRGGLAVPILGVVLVAGLGVGGYVAGLFDGLIGPGYPAVDPYTLTVQKEFESPATAVGYVPNPEVQETLAARMRDMGGSAELTLATGDIADNWGEGVLDIMESIAPLEEFRVTVENDAVQLTGLAPTNDALATVQAAFSGGFPGGLQGSMNLQLGPRFLSPDMVQPLLDRHADCGRLRLSSPPPLGYGLEDNVIVTGRFAQEASRSALRSEIAALAGNRSVRIEGEVLNDSLCQIDAVLPKAGPGGFDLRFGFGDREGENIARSYKVGDNPVIDVRLPEGVDGGYLWVSVVDVQGVVFHLLPNRVRPENSIEALRAEADEEGYVRLAYSLAEAGGTGKLAFTVDGSVLGKSKVIALHSDQPLFDELRPTTESAASYAEALAQARETGGLSIDSLDSAILTTEQ